MKSNLQDYDLYFFDCDGVLLDSNNVKSEAFYNVAKEFSPEIADDFLKYHQSHGGISRFEKFKYFFSEMLKLKEYETELNKSLFMFKEQTVLGLNNCKVVNGVEKFLKSLPENSKRYVISGGLEEEVCNALREKKLDIFFSGIYGSPKNKYEIMNLIHETSKISVFFGDSKLDYEVAKSYGCDFFFISDHTEFSDYNNYFLGKNIEIKKNFLSFFNA